MPERPRHRLYPEPGAWVLNETRGLPRVEPPEGPITEPLTTKQVADEVEYHGLGLCIFSYIFPEKIEDKILQAKWRVAREALVAVVRHLDCGDRKVKKVKRPKTKRLNLGRKL